MSDEKITLRPGDKFESLSELNKTLSQYCKQENLVLYKKNTKKLINYWKNGVVKNLVDVEGYNEDLMYKELTYACQLKNPETGKPCPYRITINSFVKDTDAGKKSWLEILRLGKSTEHEHKILGVDPGTPGSITDVDLTKKEIRDRKRKIQQMINRLLSHFELTSYTDLEIKLDTLDAVLSKWNDDEHEDVFELLNNHQDNQEDVDINIEARNLDDNNSDNASFPGDPPNDNNHEVNQKDDSINSEVKNSEDDDSEDASFVGDSEDDDAEIETNKSDYINSVEGKFKKFNKIYSDVILRSPSKLQKTKIKSSNLKRRLSTSLEDLQTPGKKHSKMQRSARIVRNDLSEINFPKKVQSRGRPAKTNPGKTVIGLKKKVGKKNFQLIKFTDMNEKCKIRSMLKWLEVPDKDIIKIIGGKSEYDSVNFSNLKESFDNDEVDTELLRTYMSFEAFKAFNIQLVKLKNKKSYSCAKCNTSRNKTLMCCDGCLLWYHITCLGLEVPQSSDWFCPSCVTGK